jgi:hypothetical protein
MEQKTIITLFKAGLMSLLMTSAACAEEAISPIEPLQRSTDNTGQASGDHTDLDLMALTFAGKDPFGTDCFLHISGFEEEHVGEADEHHFTFVSKLSYSLHGENPSDSFVEFQKYDLNTNTYYPLGSDQENTTPALVSAILKDKGEKVDYNKLTEYELSGKLLQSFRADFVQVNIEEFVESLKSVLKDNSTFESNKTLLDQLQRTVLKIQHNGHYDAAACSNFNLSDVNEIEFDLDAEHGDHDDDHDDGDDDHDHDHDH